MKRRWIAGILAVLLLVQGAAFGEETDTVYQVVSKKLHYFDLAGTGWIVEPWDIYFEPEKAREQAESFNKVTGAFKKLETYVFLVESSRSMDMDKMDEESALWKLIQENYTRSTIGHLTVDSVDTYCEHFYKTDHHWNYRGSYEGYKAIIRMMLGEDEPLLEPVETVEFPVMFNGSYNKNMKRKNSDEPFTVYRFDYPAMTVRINGKVKNRYGKQDVYFSGKYNRQPYTNHYGEFYGGDEGLAEFCTGDDSRENVIIFCNSFSNAVKMLIASHFNHTYFIDMRHYGDDMGEKLNLTASIKKWNISKVVLFGDPYLFKWGTTYR